MILYFKLQILMRTKDRSRINFIIRGRHFKITFNIENYKYYIKDLGSGFGTFLEVKSEIVFFYLKIRF